MATNGTRSIKIELREEMISELEERAASMHLFADEYCTLVLTHWLKSGQTLTITEE